MERRTSSIAFSTVFTRLTHSFCIPSSNIVSSVFTGGAEETTGFERKGTKPDVCPLVGAVPIAGGVLKTPFVAGVGRGAGEAAVPKEKEGASKVIGVAVGTGAFVSFGANRPVCNGGEVAGAVAARATGTGEVAGLEPAGGVVAGRDPNSKLKEDTSAKGFCADTSGRGDFRPGAGGVTEGGVGKEPAPFMAAEGNEGAFAPTDGPSAASVDTLSSPPSSSSTTAFANGERRVGRVLGRPSPIPNGEGPEGDVDGRGAT